MDQYHLFSGKGAFISPDQCVFLRIVKRWKKCSEAFFNYVSKDTFFIAYAEGFRQCTTWPRLTARRLLP